MGRKPSANDHGPSYRETNHTNNVDANDLYRKRLRSWKQTPTQLKTQLKSNQAVIPSAVNNHEAIAHHRSTMYTYPINFSNDRQRILPNTIHPDSLTSESAFYCPSVSDTSIQTTADLNNNHVTTMNVENERKRKNQTLSCESLSSQLLPMETSEMLPNPNDEENYAAPRSSATNLQLTYHRSPTKRSRFSTDDSDVIDHRPHNSPLPFDRDTIDINQLDEQEPPSASSLNHQSLLNNSHSMETAVKMVQPIVDIIFTAFEDQFKNVQAKTIPFSLRKSSLTKVSPPTPSSPQQLHPPKMAPYYPITPPTHPIVLHAVNFNVQLSTKQSTVNSMEKQSSSEQYLTNTSLSEFKRKVVSCVLSNNLRTDSATNNDHQGQRRKLKRLVQLTVFGVSVLCGYLLL